MIYCLHGFLGLPTDWDIFRGVWPPVQAVDLYEFVTPSQTPSLEKWGRLFNNKVKLEHPSGEKKIVVGYSMGGRLAMHALMADPEFWDAAVLISAHPGLPETAVEERSERQEKDELWAQKFLLDPWPSLMVEWNQQPVFGTNHPTPLRPESLFDREKLSLSMLHWSLSSQKDLRHELRKIDRPILWCSGSEDQKFTQIAEEMKTVLQNGTFWSAPACGHRVPWLLPKEFAQQVLAFVEKIS